MNQPTQREDSKRKMPKVPDLSAPPVAKKTAPFVLDDFTSRAADTTTKP